jgi:hypothetical protein
MSTRRTASASSSATSSVPANPEPTQKLRQTQAEYSAARPLGEAGIKPMMSSSKMYVCRRCGANFKTGEGKPDARMHGLGKCNRCLDASATTQSAAA